jgi:hypothetical protein
LGHPQHTAQCQELARKRRQGTVAARHVAKLEKQVANLRAEVAFYREKSKRAEEWLSKISSQIAYSRTLRAAEDADGNKGRCIELRHFFVTPGVAAAHALSGFAIFAGAESVLKTTPLFILGLMVPLQLIVYH